MNSKEFATRKEAQEFAIKVHGFYEGPFVGASDVKYIVFWRKDISQKKK